MASAKTYSIKRPPALGSWVRMVAASNRAVERRAATAMALVTAVNEEGQGSCTLVFPRELILRGFLNGPPFRRVEAVPLADLRSVPHERSPQLEQLLLKCLQQHMADRERELSAEAKKCEPEVATAEEPSKSCGRVDTSRDRSRSPRPTSTPERAPLVRHDSEEKLPVQPGYYPAIQEVCKPPPEISQSRLIDLTVAVSLQLRHKQGRRMEAKALLSALSKSFTALEVEAGLVALDKKNKVLCMDDMVFMIE